MTNNLKPLFAIFFACVNMTVPANADEPEYKPTVDVSMNARADYSAEFPKTGTDTRGFHGRYFNLMVNGTITENLSYSFRQRLNRQIDKDDDVFAATDWVTLNYKFNDHWQVNGGKQIVCVGGYEYDAPPIDVFFSSMFWNTVNPYQFGVSATYSFNEKHSLTAQVCNSLLSARQDDGLMGYNLMWAGHVGCLSTLWSVNAFEYAKGDFANYISLGNRFDVGQLRLELDFMNRYWKGSKFFMDNYSAIANVFYQINDVVTINVKGGYEHFKPTPGMDDTIEKPFYGGGLELYPLKKNRNLRIHALWNLTHSGTGQETKQIMAGATWRCNIFKK